VFKTNLVQVLQLRWALLAFAALFLAGFVVRSQSLRVEPLVASPEVYVAEDRIVEGNKVIWKAHLYNPNVSAVEIKGVSVSCGCTKVGSVPKVMKPREVIPLEFVINTEAMDGEKVLHSTVETFFHGRTLYLNLSCRLNVSRSLHAIPSALTLGILAPDSKVQLPVSLWDALPDGYSTLDSVTVSDSSRVQVGWQPVGVELGHENSSEQGSRAVAKRYELSVLYNARPQMRSRERIAEEIILHISAGEAKLTRKIPISGSVVPDIEFVPPNGLLGGGRDSGISRIIINKKLVSETPKVMGAVGCKASIEKIAGGLLLNYDEERRGDSLEDGFVNIRFGGQDIIFPVKRVGSLK